MKPIITGLALGTLLASSALAADMDVYTPAPPAAPQTPVYTDTTLDWTGFYAGVLGGYGFGSTDLSNTPTVGIDTNGLLGGVTLGANVQSGQFVYGLEGDVMWSGQNGSATCLGGGSTCSADYDWAGSLRARAGYAFDPVLIYATGGFAMAGINTSVSPATGGTSGSYSDTYLGWTVGGGVEAAVTDALTAKAEYAYSDYGSRTAPAGTLDTTATTVSPTSHAVKVGLNFRF